MFNSRNLGALIVDQEPHVNEWEEPQFGIRNIGIEEKYGFGVLNEGLSRSQSPSLSLSRPRDADTAGARLSRGLGTLEAAALRGWVGLFTAGCRHRQVLGHLALWQRWERLRGGPGRGRTRSAAARHRLWSPDYPVKHPVRLRARICRVRTPLPRSGLPPAPESACECLRSRRKPRWPRVFGGWRVPDHSGRTGPRRSL